MLKRIKIPKNISYAGISSIFNIVSSFIIQKVFAVAVGPSGLALINQFQNFLTIGLNLSSGGINTGVTKYTSEYNNHNKNAFRELLSTSKSITLLFSLIVNVLIFVFSDFLAIKFFQSIEYTSIIKYATICILFFSANELITSLLTGINEINKVVKGSIFRAFISLILSGTLAYFFGVKGAMYGIGTVQIIAFIYYFYLIYTSDKINLSLFKEKFNKKISTNLFKYSLVALVSAVLVPFVSILVRNHISEVLTLNEAGIWDALNKLSIGYMALVSTTVSLYYLPKISSLDDKKQISSELKKGILMFSLIISFGILFFWIFSDFFIILLFSEDFLQMNDILLPYFIGDIFKVTFMIGGITLLAKAKIKDFVFIQIVFSILNYVFAYFLINQFDLIGASYAHLLRTFLRAVVTFFFVYKFLISDDD